jgi:hypothetical protein
MTVQSFIQNHSSDNTYNGWANYETWNVALWIQNSAFLYNTAKACVEYAAEGESPYVKFIRCAVNGDYELTRDGVNYGDSKVNHAEIVEMMATL